ncbi:MAG TPA: radical SAM protein [Anaerolineae bacterium]|nr:radical SAM protein [Anaerolineae bacterium]
MRIKLVNAIFDKVRMSEPIGLCYLAAVLRQHHLPVELIDPRIRPYSVAETVDVLGRAPFDVLGISTFSFQKQQLYDMIALVRSRGFQGKIVVGGLGPTLCGEQYFRECPEIDLIVNGEGELTFLELVQAFQRELRGEAASGAWKAISGISYLDETGSLVTTAPRPRLRDLDTLPFMARDILEQNIAKYGVDMVFAAILGGRGCQYNCSYCWIAAALNRQGGTRYRQRSVARIVDEIEAIYTTYGVRRYSFEDDNFIVPGRRGLERAQEFRDQVKRRGLKIEFFFQTRPDTIRREVMEAYKEAGLAKLFIGIEAITEADTELYNKRHSPLRIERALAVLRELGYEPDVGRENQGRVRFGYITFHPLTTVNTVRASLNFFRKYNLTPKRFVKEMYLFEGDMDIKRAFESSGLISSDGTHYSFKDPRVAIVYDHLMPFTQAVFQVREEIRSVEKHTFRKQVPKDAIGDLVQFRVALDRMIFDFSDSLLKIVDAEPHDLPEMRARARAALDAEQAQLSAYLEANAVKERLYDAERKYQVRKDMFDLYW